MDAAINRFDGKEKTFKTLKYMETQQQNLREKLELLGSSMPKGPLFLGQQTKREIAMSFSNVPTAARSAVDNIKFVNSV